MARPKADKVLATPAYPLIEAAHYLNVPLTTLRAWCLGQPLRADAKTRRFEPLIRLDGDRWRALSFLNLVEDTETTFEELKEAFGGEIAEIVGEVTDVKWLKKRSRKELQVARASRASDRAKLVKLADKICNLRDIIASPPAEWSRERKEEYFDWAKRVVHRVRGTNARLERRFDQLYRKRP